MKLSKLLASRQRIIRHANLANLAYAYQTLRRLGERAAAAGLRGPATLRQADHEEETYWATLTAHEGQQSVIEEHFDEEDLMDLADAVAYALEGEFKTITFRLEQMPERFVAPLRLALEKAGIANDLDVGREAPARTD